jgi:hypothetical protein
VEPRVTRSKAYADCVRAFAAALAFAAVCIASSPGLGAESAPAPEPGPDESARQSENPIAPVVKVPFQENLEYGLGPNDRAESLFKLEPVIPLPLAGGWAVVVRTIVPFEYKPDTMATTGGTSGLGDINPTFFVAPKHGDLFKWGVGPDFELPTATQQSIGTGKLSVGPSIAFVLQPRPWTVGAIVSNIWSFAGESGSANVNKFSAQYFIHFNFKSGWTLSTSPTMTADWNAKSGDVWEIPVGGGVGKVFKLGHRVVHPSVQAYGYAASPSNGPEWLLRCQVTLVVPE